MRILVMGAGGIGGYYGARLALSGNEVVFVARGAHLERIQSRGLEVRERDQPDRVAQVQAVRYPGDAGATFDLILMTVKAYDLEEAARAVAPVVGPETCVVPLQNGVDSVDVLNGILDPTRVLAGTTALSSKVAEPGVIERLSRTSAAAVGEPSGPRTPRIERVVAAFTEAGLPDVIATDDAARAIWEKFMFLAPIATVNSATGLPTGHILSLPEGRDLVLGMQDEIRAVGLASGVNLPEESAEKVRGMFLGLPEWHTVSMQRDFEAGKRVELETLTGTVVRRGRAVGVATPRFDSFYPVLLARALQYGGITRDSSAAPA
ncbi:MAG: 2-dehydropantoate 2-reductase [Chloroflexota bacterium]